MLIPTLIYGPFLLLAEKTITRMFVCLAEKEQDRVPSTAEKLKLKNSGLGEKKLLFPVTGSTDTVKTVLQE